MRFFERNAFLTTFLNSFAKPVGYLTSPSSVCTRTEKLLCPPTWVRLQPTSLLSAITAVAKILWCCTVSTTVSARGRDYPIQAPRVSHHRICESSSFWLFSCLFSYPAGLPEALARTRHRRPPLTVSCCPRTCRVHLEEYELHTVVSEDGCQRCAQLKHEWQLVCRQTAHSLGTISFDCL